MKKLSAVVLMAAFGLSFGLTSCQKKKDYTCACTIFGQPVNYPILDVKKKDAEKACNAFEAQAKAQGGTLGFDASCTLK